MRHIFSATKLLENTYPLLLDQLAETLQNIFDQNLFPGNFITITEVPSEIIQKTKNRSQKY